VPFGLGRSRRHPGLLSLRRILDVRFEISLALGSAQVSCQSISQKQRPILALAAGSRHHPQNDIPYALFH
jgi:hypothetical protein